MGKRRGNQISLTRATTTPEESETNQDGPIELEAKETAVSQPTSTPATIDKVPEPELLRTTMFFTPDMLDRIDAAKRRLTKLTGIRGRAVSRTKIVEMALEITLAELENEQEASRLVSTLLERKG